MHQAGVYEKMCVIKNRHIIFKGLIEDEHIFKQFVDLAYCIYSLGHLDLILVAISPLHIFTDQYVTVKMLTKSKRRIFIHPTPKRYI